MRSDWMVKCIRARAYKKVAYLISGDSLVCQNDFLRLILIADEAVLFLITNRNSSGLTLRHHVHK